MKSKTKAIKLLVIIALIICSASVYSQNTNSASKIKGRIIHEEKTVKNVKNTLIDAEEKYDQKGNLIEETQYKDGKVDKRMVYEYDANNNKIKETETDASGKLKKTSEYKYENGLRTEKITFDENKKLISKKTYSYIY
jgi:antitoxin component YwqK of YwqJK toxin-antitoxin module